MLRFPRAGSSVALALAGAALVSLASAAPAGADSTLGAESPQALVERLREAAETRDLVAAARLLAPEPRTEMTTGMFFSATMMVAFSQMGPALGGTLAEAFDEDMTAAQKAEAASDLEEAQAEAAEMEAEFVTLLQRYGIDAPAEPEEGEMVELDDAALAETFAAIDQPAFLADIIAFLQRHSDATGEPPQGGVELGELENLAVDGDRATAALGGRPFAMVRLGDGRWYLESTELMQPERPVDEDGNSSAEMPTGDA